MKIMPNRLDRGFFRYQEEFERKVLYVLRTKTSYAIDEEIAPER